MGEVFVAIPTHRVLGDAMDDGILDGFAESMEIKPENIRVIENNNNFFIFSDDFQIDVSAANQQIQNSKTLRENYEKAVHYLTKLVRRADSAQNRIIECNTDIKALRAKNAELTAELEKLQKSNV